MEEVPSNLWRIKIWEMMLNNTRGGNCQVTPSHQFSAFDTLYNLIGIMFREYTPIQGTILDEAEKGKFRFDQIIG